MVPAIEEILRQEVVTLKGNMESKLAQQRKESKERKDDSEKDAVVNCSKNDIVLMNCVNKTSLKAGRMSSHASKVGKLKIKKWKDRISANRGKRRSIQQRLTVKTHLLSKENKKDESTTALFNRLQKDDCEKDVVVNCSKNDIVVMNCVNKTSLKAGRMRSHASKVEISKIQKWKDRISVNREKRRSIQQQFKVKTNLLSKENKKDESTTVRLPLNNLNCMPIGGSLLLNLPEELKSNTKSYNDFSDTKSYCDTTTSTIIVEAHKVKGSSKFSLIIMLLLSAIAYKIFPVEELEMTSNKRIKCTNRKYQGSIFEPANDDDDDDYNDDYLQERRNRLDVLLRDELYM